MTLITPYRILIILIIILVMGCIKEDIEKGENYLSVQVHSIENGTLQQEEKVYQATKLLSEAINSNEFYSKFMKLDFSGTQGLSNIQIYDKLQRGVEVGNPELNRSMDLNIHFIHRPKSQSAGIADRDNNIIYLNTKYFDRFALSRVCGTIMHEYMHQLGFEDPTMLDFRSVPYATGFLVRDIIR